MLDALASLLGGGPTANWPKLAPILKLAYEPKPPMLRGDWNGKQVTVQLGREKAEVVVAAMLSKPTRVRLEIAAKEVVSGRAGSVVPDVVAVEDEAFSKRLLARCSEKAAGAKILDSTLRQRLISQPFVDIVGERSTVIWKLPAAKDADTLENAFDVVTVLAQELEAYPA